MLHQPRRMWRWSQSRKAVADHEIASSVNWRNAGRDSILALEATAQTAMLAA